MLLLHVYPALKSLKFPSRRLKKMTSFVLLIVKNILLDFTKTIQLAYHVTKIANLARDLIITIASLVQKDTRKTGRVLLRIRSIALIAALLEAIQMKRGSVWHAMKTVKPAPDLIARIVLLVPKERRKTKEAHKKTQNIVLASAPQDFMNTKKAYAFHVIKIVRLARDQIVSIASLVPKERRRTEEVL